LNNGLVLSASIDKTIKVWNIHKKLCIQTLISHYDVLFSLCIIDKSRFVSGGRDQDIILWKY
jgi:WD40 repeat protein